MVWGDIWEGNICSRISSLEVMAWGSNKSTTAHVRVCEMRICVCVYGFIRSQSVWEGACEDAQQALAASLWIRCVYVFMLIFGLTKIFSTTHSHSHTRIHSYTHTHKYVHTYVRAYTHAPVHTCTRTHTHTPIHTYTHNHTHVHTHTKLCTHTRMITHIHTHTHAHTNTYACPFSLASFQ